ncbi:hypothetical protein [Sulfurimonas sp.]|jgi:hypothetical protein|uniref:hypothetical protein n=1 Tax=Sulfurimonas sp. TaxID=2022749 RepID=UPI0025FF4A4E|nr:hypothetical protein [Sulfurimonas sp.]MCK9473072.1 hypothetical protein [Sulfurimonas sp.]
MQYILLIFTLFFSACSIKNYEHTQTKIITIKSPKIKFYDVGYLRNSDKAIELELFIAGKSIEKIAINHLICVSDGCMSKSGFNKEYLNSAYPDDILKNILLSHAIYGGANLSKTKNGFTQDIEDKDVDIIYRVESNGVFFKDRKNSIIFNIKDLDE